MTPLLAKSPRGGKVVTLEQHLCDTEEAARTLFRQGSRWGASWLRFFRLGVGDQERFLLHLRVAALLHDLGKANADFQAAVRATGFKAQALRHEHLSALLVSDPAFRALLSNNAAVDCDVLLGAILGHHLKAAREGPCKVLFSKSAAPTPLLFDHSQLHATVARIAEIASLPVFAGRFPPTYDHEGWHDAWAFLDDRASRLGSELRRDDARRALVLAVKAGLVVADSVASALRREGLALAEWIENVAHAPALAHDDIERDVLRPRTDELSRRAPFRYQAFQEGAAQLGSRALLLAACGAGKTLAAWRWAEAVSRSEPIGRVIFLYPTRGTATEGFRDYVGHAPEEKAALVHGTARYELAGLLANPADQPPSIRGKDFTLDETEERLFSLGLWSKRFFSATVDQFLSFMENGYGALCLLPALADSAVVFDEVHSYDRHLWNALVAFLGRFDVPVLCMTATLPRTRRDELARHLRVYPSDHERSALADLERAETHPRYHLAEAARDDALQFAERAVAGGKRVLWVVNTVRRCQDLALELHQHGVEAIIVYHSRFKLEDRQARHRQTVEAFRAPPSGDPSPCIAVTTQVCEMSLDLDADVVISEHAPISSLVQRFGRGNRHLRRGEGFRATLLTYAPESAAPYERAELDAARRFLAELAGHEISQRDLAEGLERHAPPGREASGASRFVDGGMYATPGVLRDSDDSGSTAILDTDIAVFKALVDADEPTDGLRITVPRKHARPAEGLPPWLTVADGARYDAWLGFRVGDEVNP